MRLARRHNIAVECGMAKPRLTIVKSELPRDELGLQLDKLALSVVDAALMTGEDAPPLSQKNNSLKIASGYWALRRTKPGDAPGSAFEQYRREMASVVAEGEE